MLYSQQVFTQIDNSMEQKKELLLSKALLKTPISEYSAYFRKIEIEEAKEKRIPSMFNYLYSGKESLYFIKYKIKNLRLEVRNGLIYKVFFEVPYSDFKIFKDLITEFGYPGSGHGIPGPNVLIDPTKRSQDNYRYEQMRRLTWLEKGVDTYMNTSNQINKDYIIDKDTKLWVKFNIEKVLK